MTVENKLSFALEPRLHIKHSKTMAFNPFSQALQMCEFNRRTFQCALTIIIQNIKKKCIKKYTVTFRRTIFIFPLKKYASYKKRYVCRFVRYMCRLHKLLNEKPYILSVREYRLFERILQLKSEFNTSNKLCRKSHI